MQQSERYNEHLKLNTVVSSVWNTNGAALTGNSGLLKGISTLTISAPKISKTAYEKTLPFKNKTQCPGE